MERLERDCGVLVFSAFNIFPPKYGDQDAISSLLSSLGSHYEVFQPDKVKSNGVNINKLFAYNTKSRILLVLLYNMSMVFQVMKARKKKGGLIVVTTRFHLNLAATLLTVFFNIKWVSIMLDSFIALDKKYYLQSGNSFHLPFRLLKFMELLAYKKSNYVFISSAQEITSLYDKFGRLAHEKIRRTPLSTKMIDCVPNVFIENKNSNFSKLVSNKEIYFISFHGNFLENIPSLGAAKFIIETLAWNLYKLDPKIYILLMGEGLEKYDFTSYRNVCYLGFVDNLCDYLSLSCLEIAPILGGQGIKMKILDAMALGKPVITTLDGARGFIEPNPIIVENIDNFAESIVSLVNDRNKLVEIGKESKDYVLKYYSKSTDFKKIINSLKKTY